MRLGSIEASAAWTATQAAPCTPRQAGQAARPGIGWPGPGWLSALGPWRLWQVTLLTCCGESPPSLGIPCSRNPGAAGAERQQGAPTRAARRGNQLLIQSRDGARACSAPPCSSFYSLHHLTNQPGIRGPQSLLHSVFSLSLTASPALLLVFPIHTLAFGLFTTSRPPSNPTNPTNRDNILTAAHTYVIRCSPRSSPPWPSRLRWSPHRLSPNATLPRRVSSVSWRENLELSVADWVCP